ncbi:hypothetical protein IVB12_15615 [Bradyrhizobium sp. 179]|uniref:hypothetical protein n=1 Tax=Bradyrhizobium sp. 179 TaxID=2782648 RepID=UPI001FF89857|nr:hypothetical protein [Bradyrhizobium sp. 179]MCK1543343.1 hypothetical protein [Bradyrhizobium sp. 179]
MTERLGIKRKLTNSQKMKLAKLAWTKFIDPKLRTKEEKARQHVVEAILAGAKAITAVELKALRKFDMTQTFRYVDAPYQLRIQTGEKEFTVGDKTVTRPETQLISRPRDWDQFTPISMKTAMSGGFEVYESERYLNYGKTSPIDLGQVIEVPAYGGHFASLDGEQILDGQVDHNGSTGAEKFYFHYSPFMTPKIDAAFRAYFQIARERAETEGKMAMTACRLINASTHYQQILEFWPEAAEIEGDLFEDRLPSAVSLVTISDEDKALLCRNMRSRGVKGSDLCKVAA